MFIFGGLCGLVFGRALTPTRPTIEPETEGRRRDVGRCLPYPCTPDWGLLCFQGGATASADSAPGDTLRTHVTSAVPGLSAPPGPIPASTHILTLSLQKTL